jgi:hypothetical protein
LLGRVEEDRMVAELGRVVADDMRLGLREHADSVCRTVEALLLRAPAQRLLSAETRR